MKKIISLFLTLAIVVVCISGCSIDNVKNQPTKVEKQVTVKLGGLKGPTSMGMVKLLTDAEDNKTESKYSFVMAGSADELTAKILKGDLDILAVPVNLGAVLYNNSKGKVQMLAINTLGVMYITENNGKSISSVADLRGKTIYSTGKGSTPEYVLNYILSSNKIDPNSDVKIEWKSEPTEVVAAMTSSKEDTIALLPEPFVTVAKTKLPNLSVALDLTDEWEKIGNDSKLLTAGLIVRTDFAKEHSDVIESFLSEYKESTEYINENVKEASALVEKYDIVKAPIAEKAIPNCNITSITGKEMAKLTENYFSILYKANPQSIGGKMPEKDFYYVK